VTGSWQHTASIYQGARAVGGKIEVRSGTLEFVPHVFDRTTGGRSWTAALESVVSVEETARSWRASSFSPRRCLLIRTDDGREAKFLVNGLRDLVERLEGAVRQARH
jgi:hypothetical protein